MKRLIPFIALLSIVLTVSCGKKELASVGERVFTAAELEKQVSKIDPAALQQYGEKRLKETLLNRMIETELLFRDLKEKKYDEKEDIARRWEEIRPDVELTYFVNEYIRHEAAIPEKELKKEYEKRLAQFETPEKVKASHILIQVGDRHTDEEALALITDVKKKIDSKGSNFGDLAREYSEGPSASRDGDLGWFSRGQMVKPFEEAAFGMKKGEVSSEPVKTQFGYHLIRITDKAEAGRIPYKEAKNRLKYDVYNALLKKEYGVAVYPEKASPSPSDDIVAEIQKTSTVYSNKAFLEDLSKWMNEETMAQLFKNADALYGTLNDLIIRKAYRGIIDSENLRESEGYTSFMDEMKKEYLVQNYLDETLFTQIKVTAEEVREAYENNPALMKNLAEQYGERFLSDKSFRRSKEKEFFPYLEQQIINNKKQQLYDNYIITLKSKYPVEISADFS
ncbi:MAG TPA: peptidylprolyl isomerase [Candidatus Mcinerneyibacteriales bacterium]|nr:peptidylprolyl isomerase [Candidatus Mcinerneyibacteriales bacterium]HPE19812.1 peptidylprolyl isomerase [Candidatus Mcinerneyibacteriales bacterium]HPJ69882.1 peptidylprolyl isomerase [Candidatus Mcinerneyibacteriales bacterium]HPQ89065.1 peptidylprolyl isomerase [Candidatus Mcinerneyibacteriales bacterium]